jgi:hypothetical protein
MLSYTIRITIQLVIQYKKNSKVEAYSFAEKPLLIRVVDPRVGQFELQYFELEFPWNL